MHAEIGIFEKVDQKNIIPYGVGDALMTWNYKWYIQKKYLLSHDILSPKNRKLMMPIWYKPRDYPHSNFLRRNYKDYRNLRDNFLYNKLSLRQ